PIKWTRIRETKVSISDFAASNERENTFANSTDTPTINGDRLKLDLPSIQHGSFVAPPINTREAAKFYIDQGFTVVPVKRGAKAPNLKNWQTRKFTHDDISEVGNLGIRLGPKNGGLVDIDWDTEAARRTGPLVWGEGCAFGRKGKTPGHILVRSTDSVEAHEKFSLGGKREKKVVETLGLEKTMILEVRASGVHQTIFPPSVHENGDEVVWTRGAPTSLEALPSFSHDEIMRRAGLNAFLALVLQAYPSKGGRDEFCFALAGVLAHAGYDAETIDRLIVGIASLAGDEEAGKRRKGERVIADLESGEPVGGLPRFLSEYDFEQAEKKIRAWLQMKGKSPRQLETGAIMQEDGALERIVTRAEEALANSSVQIFRRAGVLVRTATVEGEGIGDDGVSRKAGSLVLSPVVRHWLRYQMARVANWGRYDAKGNPIPADPAMDYANAIIDRADETPFPPLRAIIQAPTIDRNGEVLTAPGYDRQSQLFLDIEPGSFPQIPERPTRADALAGLETLKKPIAKFPFPDKAALAVALSAMLTSVVRASLPTAPMILFDAPSAGSGKSKLSAIAGIMATGKKPAVMSQGPNEEEDEKRLSAALMAGDSVLVIDNCTRPLSGDFLCSMMVEQSVRPRVLGRSELKNIPCTALVMANGNNIGIRGDMGRRVIRCRIDPEVERPEKRRFDFDPVEMAIENREELVTAALTIMRAYIVSSECVDVEPFGSFEGWSRLVREALIWIGCADPCETREQIVAEDGEKEEFADLLAHWEHCHAGDAVYVKDMQNLPVDDSRPAAQDLHSQLVMMSNRPAWNSRSIGRVLERFKERVVNGRKLVRLQKTMHGVAWQMVSTDGTPLTRMEYTNEPF
ncbi:MAG: bifunctional DNA primase/polymerase, partial [Pseudomonadota bacterium]